MTMTIQERKRAAVDNIIGFCRSFFEENGSGHDVSPVMFVISDEGQPQLLTSLAGLPEHVNVAHASGALARKTMEKVSSVDLLLFVSEGWSRNPEPPHDRDGREILMLTFFEREPRRMTGSVWQIVDKDKAEIKVLHEDEDGVCIGGAAFESFTGEVGDTTGYTKH